MRVRNFVAATKCYEDVLRFQKLYDMPDMDWRSGPADGQRLAQRRSGGR